MDQCAGAAAGALRRSISAPMITNVRLVLPQAGMNPQESRFSSSQDMRKANLPSRFRQFHFFLFQDAKDMFTLVVCRAKRKAWGPDAARKAKSFIFPCKWSFSNTERGEYLVLNRPFRVN